MTKADTPPSPPVALSPKQEKAAVLIGTGSSISAAARELGLTRQTVSGWAHGKTRAGPAFLGFLDRTKAEHQAQVKRQAASETTSLRDQTRHLIPKGARRLEELLDAESYVIDGEGKVHTFAANRTRLSALRLLAQIHGQLAVRVEHSGEVGVALRGVPDDELLSSVRRVIGVIPGLGDPSSN